MSSSDSALQLIHTMQENIKHRGQTQRTEAQQTGFQSVWLTWLGLYKGRQKNIKNINKIQTKSKTKPHCQHVARVSDKYQNICADQCSRLKI